MTKRIAYLMLLTLCVKILLIMVWGDFSSMNPDEETNYTVARNYLDGKGYSKGGELTSFHGSFSVYIYRFLIENKISKKYYIGFVHLVAIILFVASIPVFYRMARTLGIGSKASFFSAALYCFYPSNIWFIGNIFLYEKVVLPLLVGSFYLLYRLTVGMGSSIMTYIVPVVVAISCLLRPHLIAVYFFVFFSFFLYSVRTTMRDDRHNVRHGMFILTPLLLIVAHIPILAKNYSVFGSYVLSTQVGYELMQGHNDLARGSWNGNWNIPGSPYYTYSRKVIPNIDTLNEYEEGKARKKYALQWIVDNPIKELVLLARKSAMFMLPRNYMSGFHPANLLVHSAFLVSLVLMLFSRRTDSNSLLLLGPILGSYILCVIFFVGARWRHYAEPFFILFATYHLCRYATVKILTTDGETEKSMYKS